MAEMMVGYARCSTRGQDLRAQRTALKRLGVEPDRIYTDKGYTGRNRERPGLHQALAACREGDVLVVTKLDRLGRSMGDLRAIADELESKGTRLSIGGSIHDPTDLMGKFFFGMLSLLAEFEADLISSRTREGMAEAKKAGRLKGKQPRLSPLRRKKLLEEYESGDYSPAELCEFSGLSRSAMYATLQRAREDRDRDAGEVA
ncbi:recombinase family protein [Rhodococcus hoagii]|nr:recombinase family protein [Prescottella equi]NKS10239.1 recombinase family protein [Prescottella equi]NKS35230.1 recombinase family protein [Prescottella equi]NKS62077.1 recombinase family protein [Prescottella equi]NKS68253.1 recombinase family protein [Prescottella equi]